MLKPNKINLATRLGDNPARAAAGRRRARLLVPAAALVAAVLAFRLSLALFFMAPLEDEQAALTAYLSDPAAAQALELLERQDRLADERQALAALLNDIDSFPEFDRALHEAVYAAAAQTSVRVEFVRYNRQEGRLEVACTGPGPLSASDYVARLRQDGRALDPVYGGYREDTRESGLIYAFEVSCRAAEGGGGS